MTWLEVRPAWARDLALAASTPMRLVLVPVPPLPPEKLSASVTRVPPVREAVLVAPSQLTVLPISSPMARRGR